MSKEMMVIALGLWIIVVRTLLGVPGHWQTFLFIVTGVALAVLGFLLRGEALSRAMGSRDPRVERGSTYPFVENNTVSKTNHTQTVNSHEHKERITSLN
jgi:hypothetical protein